MNEILNIITYNVIGVLVVVGYRLVREWYRSKENINNKGNMMMMELL
jgi:hypothetical protein